MAVAFGAVYQKQQASGQWTYLLAAGGTVQPNQPWTGIYIASDQQLSLGAIATLDPIFTQFENRKPFNLLVFLYFAASTAPNPAQIGAALDAVNWRHARYSGAVTWIADPAIITQASVDAAPRLPFEPYAPSPRSPVVPSLSSPERQPLLALAPGQSGGESLFVTGGDKVTIGGTAAGDGA